MIQKITESTKVKDWVARINELIDEVGTIAYSWDTVSVKGKQSYTFDKNKFKTFSSSGEYVVLYAGIELNKKDYTIAGDTLTFKSPPEEDGCSIRIRYLRSI
jgi:hypothetical protein